MADLYTIDKTEHGFTGRFKAMNSPCEILMDLQDPLLAQQLVHAAYTEAKRIEQKFSRYISTNLMFKMNNSQGETITLDEESSLLMDFAFTCFDMSDGLFDVTSGILRRAWTFDGSDALPCDTQITELLPFIGLQKVSWKKPYLTMPNNMELDFGGIGKEYAVDRCLQKAMEKNTGKRIPILINFGGDLVCNGPRFNQQPWQVGIESVGGGHSAVVSLRQGALATSGDARRFLLKDGVRYSHILNPKTGRPIMMAPRSITVTAASCIEAGLLSTLAMLQGRDAQSFLAEQDVTHWIQD
jgi:thiamine biosynthesis lipoprotein